MKVMNPEYKRIGIEPINITLRDVLGVSVDIDRLDELHDIVKTSLENKDKYREKIDAVMPDYVYYPGRSGEAGGKYIMSRLDKGSSPQSANHPDCQFQTNRD
jgi:YidC/Oxa1 family membrane protein insertase